MKRVFALDILRGITIIGMILVNTPGSWTYTYSPLLHAPWHGCTVADLVFPFFLFIMGLSMSLSMSKYGNSSFNDYKPLIGKVLKRGAMLFLIGLFLNTFPQFNLLEIRIPGVLQRIALVFVISAFILFRFNILQQYLISASILISYWLIMIFVPVPNTHITGIETSENLAAWVDSQLLMGHMWNFTKTWDPEGILSTFPAIVSGLLGISLGLRMFRSQKEGSLNVKFLLIEGFAFIGLGMIWHQFFPINKSLWTSSYVLLTTGIGYLIWISLFWLLDMKKWRSSILNPIKSFGMNAITSYGLSIMTASILYTISVGDTNAYDWIYQQFFNSWLDPYLASLMFAITFIVVMYLPIGWMDRKKIYLKV